MRLWAIQLLLLLLHDQQCCFEEGPIVSVGQVFAFGTRSAIIVTFDGQGPQIHLDHSIPPERDPELTEGLHHVGRASLCHWHDILSPYMDQTQALRVML